MLKSIYIHNFAIIDKIELDFFSGMSVLTGETGAGKSIIIDALNLALGNRADRSAAKDLNNKVEVVATFICAKNIEVIEWLKDHDLYTGDECVLRRIIAVDGKSKAYINDSPCSVTVLRKFGDLLVDVYGQHEHQSLMKKDKQRELLDGFAENTKNIHDLASIYRQWQALKIQIDSIEGDQGSINSRLDLLRYQNQELEQLNLSNKEYETITEQHARLHNAKELHQGSLNISHKLAGDNEDTLYDHLSTLEGDLENISKHDEQLNDSLESIRSIQIQLKDLATSLRNYSDSISTNPEDIQELETRISSIEDIAHKHRVKPEQLQALHKKLSTELSQLEKQHEDPQKIKALLEKTEQKYRTLAKNISSARKSAANDLNEKITESMQALGMQGGRFHIDVQAKNTTDLSLNGLDEIEFLVNTNSGQALRPLNKVASGGELSRLSLAIQMATANNLKIPSLIFDEVDTGVGGATAEMVGRYLRNLGKNAQVFCVTHLPQVAAQGHHHYKVNKIEEKGMVSTEIMQLDEAARIEELARMLGGVETTRNTHEYAKEILNQIKNSSYQN